jgi:predicted dehydrogenase
MCETLNTASPRRDFLKKTAGIAAASALAGVAVPPVHAAEQSTIQLALIGCGGRGSGAVGDALSCGGGPVKLVAMADLFADRQQTSYKALSKQFGDRIDVPAERQFLGFDAYRKAIDCLRPGDVALLTTHAAFRMVHFEYAIEKGVHVFMEKDFVTDPAGVQRMLRLGEAADQKGIKVACGVMCRHSASRQALIDKIRAGELGDVHLIRAYRMGGAAWLPAWKPQPNAESEVLWQIRHAYKFLWASAGFFSEMMIHQIDECCWIKDSWPIAAQGAGGRVVGSQDYAPDVDSYSIEYTFADGAKAFVTGRWVPNCFDDFSTYVHGTKCAAQFSGNVHAPTTQIYKDQRIAPDNVIWKPEREKISPYHAEWAALLGAIRDNRPHNETRRAALSNLASIMGRAAVHMGRIVTWDEAMASKFEFCPNVAELTKDSPAPVRADAAGRYQAPVPGAWREI